MIKFIHFHFISKNFISAVCMSYRINSIHTCGIQEINFTVKHVQLFHVEYLILCILDYDKPSQVGMVQRLRKIKRFLVIFAYYLECTF